MSIKRRPDAASGEFAVIPLIDVIMVIVIFLLVMPTTAPGPHVQDLSGPEEDHQLPRGHGQSTDDDSPARVCIIVITHLGHYQIDNEILTPGQLRERLKGQQRVLVNADKRASVQALVCLRTIVD